MGLATYDELIAKVESYLEDEDVVGQVPDFITLAESSFDQDLRLREMHNTVSDQWTLGGVVDLPTDFLEIVQLVATTNPKFPMQYLPPHIIEGTIGNLTTGQPRYYTILGNTLQVYPRPDDIESFGYELWYYQKIPRLSASNQTNWLLDKDPALYLYSTLMEAEPYFINDPRVATWMAMRKKHIDALSAQDARARYRPYGVMRPSQVGMYEGRRFYP